MQTHDGVVTVYSQPGEGTVFHLYFPADSRGEALPPAATEEETPRGSGELILVVDDEEVLAQLGQKSLNALGYRAEITTRPEDALARVTADPRRFALVLTDNTMPGMNGLTLAVQLHAIRPDLPVVLTTGYIAKLTPEVIAAAGIARLLHKPTNLHALGVAVHEALSAASSSASGTVAGAKIE